MTAKARLLSLRSAFWCGVVAVLYLALKAQPEQEMLRGWDKTNHLLAFAALGVLGAYSWPDRLLRLFTGLAAYGALIEVLQWFTPDRQADGWDILGNLLGLLISWLALQMLRNSPLRR